MPAKWIMLYALLTANASAADAIPPDTAPPMEMLEFLGNWETTKGESVDPAQFADTASIADKLSEDNLHDKHK